MILDRGLRRRYTRGGYLDRVQAGRTAMILDRGLRQPTAPTAVERFAWAEQR